MANDKTNKEAYKRLRHQLTDRRRYYSKKYDVNLDLPLSPYDMKGRGATEQDYYDAIQELIQYAENFEESLNIEKYVKTESDKINVEPEFYRKEILPAIKEEYGNELPPFHVIAIDRFYQSLNVADNVTGAKILSEAMVSIEENVGSEAFAQMLEDAENAGVHFEVWMAYDEGKVELYIDELTSFLDTSEQQWIAKETARSIYDAYEEEL